MTERSRFPGKVVVVDDDPDVAKAATLLLKRHFSGVSTLHDPKQLKEALLADCVAVLLDLNFTVGARSGMEGMKLLRQIRSRDPHVGVVLATAYGEVELAVKAMKEGASDFVLKPWENQKLVATLRSAARLCISEREREKLFRQNRELQANAVPEAHRMLGDSAGLRRVRSLIAKAAPTDANVLITGENGTGKELVARELHRLSRRADGPFVRVDLGALPESLFESEMFGSKRGAYTGALEDREGRFVAANGGTLFLDEVGNLPLTLQPKLLTALEQRVVSPLGSESEKPVDVRVIAATNVNMSQLGDEKRFRPDLLYRLNTVEIEVPPLRLRREDIPVLAHAFMMEFCRKYDREELLLSSAALQEVESAAWPGNIRALRHCLERAVIMAEGKSITPDDLALTSSERANESDSSRREGSGELGQEEPPLELKELERQAIERAMAKYKGNISHMAKALGITRAALYRRLDRHGLGS